MDKYVIAGKQAPDAVCDTVFDADVRLSDLVSRKEKTCLIFLRYYGCRICQLDLMEFAEEYELFRKKNAQLLVVLQSGVETMRAQTKPGDMPFELICDPEGKLYELYEVGAASSKEELITQKAKEKVQKAADRGIVHGAYEGNELQLPAAFLLDRQMRVLHAHRGTDAADLPSPEELANML